MRASETAAVAVAAFVACFSSIPLRVAAQSCTVTSEVGFEFEHSPRDGLVVYWTTPADTISFKVSIEAESWLSLGFSENGLMVDADAVILLPVEDTIDEYIMTAKGIDGITLSDSVDISETSYTQAGGVTTLQFTRNTSPADEDSEKQEISTSAGSTTNIIWAYSEENAFGFHFDFRGGFSVDLTCPSSSGVAETAAPTATPARADDDADEALNEDTGGAATMSVGIFGAGVTSSVLAVGFVVAWGLGL